MYIYGLIPAGSDPGVAERFEHAGFAALYAPWEGPPPPITGALAREHDRVVRACFQTGPILPCPAGSVESEADLRSWMEAHAAEVLAALAQVAGQVEFGVMLPSAGRPGSATGREYLEHLRRGAAARASLRNALEQVGLVHETEPPGGFEVLVPADRAEELRRLAAEYGAKSSGPWPPYYFAGVMVQHGRTAAAERDPGGCGAGAGPAGAGPGGAGAPVAGA